MGVSIRAVNDADLEAVYDICLRTGNAGNDASSLYRDPTLLGSIYVGPYVMLPEGRGFVAPDDPGGGGYVLGTHDTRTLEEACEAPRGPARRTTSCGSCFIDRPPPRTRSWKVIVPTCTSTWIRAFRASVSAGD